MGAGVLPTTIFQNNIYFLFGKENQFEESAKGFSDFGGGTDNNESYLTTAVREAGEELTGFLGSKKEVKTMLTKYGNIKIDYKSGNYATYRTHIFPIKYDEKLPFYYNNNQRFIQKHLDPKIIKKTRIFEKEEIKWISLEDLPKMRGIFRPFYRNIIDEILLKREIIETFIRKAMKKINQSETRKQKSFKTKTMKKR
jgi:hypothetical protein